MIPTNAENPALTDARADAKKLVLPPLETEGGGGAVIWEIVRISFENLLGNRMRSLLTMLGVIIGVASVVALLSLGQGAQAAVTNEVESLGTNLIFVVPGSSRNGGPGNASVAASLTSDDAAAIAALNLPLNGISPEFDGSAQVIAPAADKNATIVGVTAAYWSLNSLSLATGSLFNDESVRSASSTVVLGSKLATDLFGSGTAVGQIVRLNGKALRVVGVLASKGGGGGFGSVDDRAFVPITLAQQQLFNGRTPDGNSYRVSAIMLSAINGSQIPGIESRISGLLRDRHHLKPDGSNDDFTIIDQKSFLTTLTTITTMLTVFIGAVAGISLVVGGIGIMNIMLVSVTERTREIGLRKAVGAQSRDILLQFVVEAVVISVMGGIIGLLLSGAGLTAVTLSGIFAAPITLTSAAVALGFSTVVGLFFGIYPARRAARLNPIDALRYE